MTTGLIAALSATVLVTGAVVWWLRRRYMITTVMGSSMRPTYDDGDRVLVRRVPRGDVKRRDVVVLADDRGPSVAMPSGARHRVREQLIIKRAVAIAGDPVPEGIPVADATVPAGRLIILGDNHAASHDSRMAGFFRSEKVVGVVVRSIR